MDDYDPRRLPAFAARTLRLSADELAALASVDPTLTPDALEALAAEPPAEQRLKPDGEETG